MPVPLIAAIATIAAAGTSTGLAIDSALNQPGTPKPPSGLPTPLTSSQNSAQTAAVGRQLPTLQSLTGGSVSPEYAAQFGSTQAGTANDPQATGNIQAAINSFFGLAAPGSSGLTAPSGGGSPGGAGILDILSKGKPPATSGPGGTDFVDSLLGGGDFKGLAS